MSVVISGADALAARLEAMQVRLRDLSAVTTPIATEVRALITTSLVSARSPDGKPWAPKKDGTPFDTARLVAATSVTADPRGFTIRIATEFAAFWNFGTRHMPARPFVPLELGPGGVRWMTNGSAGVLFKSIVDRIKRHVLG